MYFDLGTSNTSCLHSPANYKELFNYWHAQLCNVIECAFGVAKKKFAILREGSEFDKKKQANLVTAFIVIFDFMQMFGSEQVSWTPPKQWRDIT